MDESLRNTHQLLASSRVKSKNLITIFVLASQQVKKVSRESQPMLDIKSQACMKTKDVACSEVINGAMIREKIRYHSSHPGPRHSHKCSNVYLSFRKFYGSSDLNDFKPRRGNNASF